jgi:beta-1,4-mannosyltransferase
VISILAFPVSNNPYTERFYPALASLGVRIEEGKFAGRWLLRHLRGFDYVHLHWPSFFYHRPRRLDSIKGFLLFVFLVGLARWRGARVIWTIHNLYPHERCVIPVLDLFVRRILIATATYFPVHGPSAEQEVVQAFPRIKGRTILIDHGHWIGYYPNQTNKFSARARLDVGERDFVYLFIGLCKPYKNLEGMIAAFETLPPHTRLIIAGRFSDSSYEERVRARIGQSKAADRILLIAKYVADDELQQFVVSADVVVAPYTEVLTSGTAMLALTFARPIIAPARGFLIDVVGEGCGILYPAEQSGALERAMVKAMSVSFDADKIAREAAKHDWNKSAQALLNGLTRI